MASASHRANLLGDYDYVGIAVVEETSGKLWVTVVFMRQLGQEPESAEEPVPYAEEQPAPGPAPSAPVAAASNAGAPNAVVPATTRVAAAAPAPEPVRVIAFTRAKGQPIVD
jgi:hypothetical protein